MKYKITKQKGINMMRKCFYYEDDEKKPILAAGILFVNEENGKKFVLMQKVIEKDNLEKYSDFGGKIDEKDDTVFDTIAREFGEELNFGLYEKDNKENLYLDTTEKLKDIILKNIIKLVYQKTAKYLIIIAKLPKNIMLDTEKIGDFEKLDKINRIVDWISYEDFIKNNPNQIHPRLWGNQILQFFTPKKFGFSKSS